MVVSPPTQGKYCSGCIGVFEPAVIVKSSPGMIAQLGICNQENLSNFIVDLPYFHPTAVQYVTNHDESEVVGLIRKFCICPILIVLLLSKQENGKIN